MGSGELATTSRYDWISGQMPGIKQEAYIASGGFGQMMNEDTGQRFARKILRIFGDVTREDVDNEAAVISQVCRPGQSNTVVEVYDHGWLPGPDPLYYYVDMEFCEETLEEWIQNTTKRPSITPKISGEGILDILQNITSGLEYLHQNGLVHRDLKPKNALFSQRDQRWKLADFGTTSEASSKRLNTTRFSRGTSSYRAPEILEECHYNNKADMFALGCIICEIAMRGKLFSGDVAVWEYAAKGDPLVPKVWPDCVLGSSLHRLGRLASDLVEIEPANRPSAVEVLKQLVIIREFDRKERAALEASQPLQHAEDEMVQPRFTGIYRQGDPGSGIGGYDLISGDDRAFAFDYLHSGVTDHLVLYRPGTGTIWILRNDNGKFQPVYKEGCPGNGIGGYDLASPDDRVFAFDYEHSGKLDHLVLYRPGTGTIWILRNKDGAFTPVYQEGCPGKGIGGYDLLDPEDYIFAFDYDHSGCADHLVLYRPASMRHPPSHGMTILKNQTGHFTEIQTQIFLRLDDLGQPTRILAFDYKRSGKPDHILVYSSENATEMAILENREGVFTTVFSQKTLTGGLAVEPQTPQSLYAYDYDGSGNADHLVVYWPKSGRIVIFRNDVHSFTPVYSSENGIGKYDLRSPADRIFSFSYFPKGTASQMCLYRPGTGTFWILRRF